MRWFHADAEIEMISADQDPPDTTCARCGEVYLVTKGKAAPTLQECPRCPDLVGKDGDGLIPAEQAEAAGWHVPITPARRWLALADWLLSDKAAEDLAEWACECVYYVDGSWTDGQRVKDLAAAAELARSQARAEMGRRPIPPTIAGARSSSPAPASTLAASVAGAIGALVAPIAVAAVDHGRRVQEARNAGICTLTAGLLVAHCTRLHELGIEGLGRDLTPLISELLLCAGVPSDHRLAQDGRWAALREPSPELIAALDRVKAILLGDAEPAGEE